MSRRDPPTGAYTPNDRTLTMHPAVLEALREVAVAFAADQLEWCALLYGTRHPAGADVERVVVPVQENHRTYYNVTGDAMAAASALAGDRLLVCQVHAHPGVDVEHSTIDDEKAASLKALSLVLPHYGTRLPAIDGLGVHDYQQHYWHLLDDPFGRKKINVTAEAPIPVVMDLR